MPVTPRLELAYPWPGHSPARGNEASFRTTACAAAERGGLAFRFRAACPGNPRAEHAARKSKVFEDDCVEAFIDPGLGRYYCWEMNAVCALLDYRARGRAGAIEFDYGWESDCSLIASILPEGGFECSLFVPWSDFSGEEVARLEEWRGSYNRIAREGDRRYYASSAPFISERPDFHRPEEFLRLGLSSVETWTQLRVIL